MEEEGGVWGGGMEKERRKMRREGEIYGEMKSKEEGRGTKVKF